MTPPAMRKPAIRALTVAALLLPLAWCGWYVMTKHVWVQDNLARVEPRHARLLGLEMQKAEIAQAQQRATALRQSYVYPAAQDSTQTGNLAQQQVRNIFTAAGLQVSSSQVLPSKEVKGFDRIPLSVRAEGELLAVQSALAVLSSQQPAILLDEITVQLQGRLNQSNTRVQPRLAVVFSLSVLRERS